MTDQPAMVYVVDDDASVRDALGLLMRSAGLAAQTFGSALEFLEHDLSGEPGCIVLDVRMPSQGGLDLQEQLTGAGIHLPIVFLTGHGDVPSSVRAMKAGAVDFLEKPLESGDLLAAVRRAIDRDREQRREQLEFAETRRRVESLTAREREVFELVVTGKLNKQVALELGISEKTVKVHRAHVMEKMKAESFAELVRLGERRESGSG